MSCASHVHCQKLILYAKPFELAIEIVFRYCTTPPCKKLIVSNGNSAAELRRAHRLCFCVAAFNFKLLLLLETVV